MGENQKIFLLFHKTETRRLNFEVGSSVEELRKKLNNSQVGLKEEEDLTQVKKKESKKNQKSPSTFTELNDAVFDTFLALYDSVPAIMG